MFYNGMDFSVLYFDTFIIFLYELKYFIYFLAGLTFDKCWEVYNKMTFVLR